MRVFRACGGGDTIIWWQTVDCYGVRRTFLLFLTETPVNTVRHLVEGFGTLYCCAACALDNRDDSSDAAASKNAQVFVCIRVLYFSSFLPLLGFSSSSFLCFVGVVFFFPMDTQTSGQVEMARVTAITDTIRRGRTKYKRPLALEQWRSTWTYY